MSEVLLYSDLHIHAHKRSIDRLNNCLEVQEWVFETAKERLISDIIFAGDLFQDREKIDVFTYTLTFKLFKKYLDGTIRLWLLLGNHDLWFRDRWDVSSVHPFDALNGVTVIDKPCTLAIQGRLVDFLPYVQNPVEHLLTLGQSDAEILVAHLACHGAQLNRVYDTRADVIVEHDNEMVKVDSSLFSNWKKVWLGHYHGHQKVSDNVEYIGSPLQLSFNEAFQHKYIVACDLKTGKRDYIKNTFSPQHLIIPQKDLEKYEIKNNFVILETDESNSANIIDLKNEIVGLSPGSLEIIQTHRNGKKHEIEDAKAILLKEDEMLDAFVEQSETGDLEKELLKKVGRKVCKK